MAADATGICELTLLKNGRISLKCGDFFMTYGEKFVRQIIGRFGEFFRLPWFFFRQIGLSDVSVIDCSTAKFYKCSSFIDMGMIASGPVSLPLGNEYVDHVNQVRMRPYTMW